MRDPVSLRPVTAEDRDFLFEVYASTRTDELMVTGWSDDQKKTFLCQQFDAQYRYYLQQFPDAEFQIITCRDHRVGRFYVDRRAQDIGIIDISVLPAFRGQGIGDYLIRCVLADGAASRIPVRIHVERFNRASGLYDRLGFRPIGDAGVYLHLEWTPPASGSTENKPCQNP